MRALRPISTKRHGEAPRFIYKELKTCSHVFVRHDAVRKPLQSPYDGPFLVKNRNDKAFDVDIRGKTVTVSIDRLKPAFVLTDDKDSCERRRSTLNNNNNKNINNNDKEVNDSNKENAKKAPSSPPVTTTRYGRRVRFNLKQT